MREYTWNNIKQANRNPLLAVDDSVDGVKTGHTESAGYCLVASAKEGDMRLVSALLGSKSEDTRLTESQALLRYGASTRAGRPLAAPACGREHRSSWMSAFRRIST